jgi:hypothetical protein
MNARDARSLIEKLKALPPQRQTEVEQVILGRSARRVTRAADCLSCTSPNSPQLRTTRHDA